MKQVQAYVRIHKKDAIHDALHRRQDISGMTVIEVQGWGSAKRHAEERDSAEQVRDFEPYLKIELFCQDAVVNEIADIIKRAAHTGIEGDGTIYISFIEERIRITPD